MHVHIRFVMCA